MLYHETSPREFAKPIILSKKMKVGGFSVVARRPPGEYTAAEGDKIIARYDVVSYQKLEAGEVVYFWNGHEFHTLITSE